MEQAQFVVVGVADGSNAVAVRQAAAVELAVETKALGRVSDLHRARDATVLKRADADKVRAAVSDESPRAVQDQKCARSAKAAS